jgi:hypothetical protein
VTQPLTITLCGSLTRARHDLARIHRALALAGHLVHAPMPPLPGEAPATPEQLDRLTERHLAAIDRSDLVATDGYLGPATRAEMNHAEQQHVPIRVVVDAGALTGDVAAWLNGAEVTA